MELAEAVIALHERCRILVSMTAFAFAKGGGRRGGGGGGGAGGDAEGGSFDFRQWMAKLAQSLGKTGRSLGKTALAVLLLLSIFYASNFIQPLMRATITALRWVLRLDGAGSRRVSAHIPCVHIPGSSRSPDLVRLQSSAPAEQHTHHAHRLKACCAFMTCQEICWQKSHLDPR